MDSIQKELFRENLITEEQEQFLTRIENREIVSVFYETRTLLYLGVLLLTSGIGLLVYQNMGQMAHIALIFLLIALEAVCWWYIIKNQTPYSNNEIKSPTPYFDYVVLLGSLLIISIFTYLMLQFDLVEILLQWSSLISAIVFFGIAFRYDHRGVLSLAITAFCAFWGLTISPVNWVSFDFDNYRSLYVSGIIIGSGLIGTGFGLAYQNIKPHFKFTFQNFGLILYYTGLISAIFESDYWFAISILGVITSVFISIHFWKHEEYLPFVYGCIGGYISFTRLLIEIADDVNPELWFMYIIASMIGFIVLIERIINQQRKSKRDASI